MMGCMLFPPNYLSFGCVFPRRSLLLLFWGVEGNGRRINTILGSGERVEFLGTVPFCSK